MSSKALKIGGYQGPQSVHTRAAHVFAEEVARLSSGDLAVEVEENVTARGPATSDLPPMVQKGELSFCYLWTTLLDVYEPNFALLDLPFLVNGRDAGYALVDGPLGTRLAESLEQSSGLRVLAYWDNGFRHITNSVRPIHVPADCKGLRTRTTASDIQQDIFRAFGFEPVPMDARDLSAAVREGKVNAQENPLTNCWNFGVFEHHRHLTLTGHLFGAAALLVSGEALDRLSEAERDAIAGAAIAATQAQRRFAGEEDEIILGRLPPLDVEVVRLEEAERAEWVASVAPLVTEKRGGFPAELAGLI